MTVQFILISDIIVKDRARLQFNPEGLTNLQDSISDPQVGLINPISLTKDNRLIAGERRLKSISILHTLQLPVYFKGELVPLDTIPAIVCETLLEQVAELKQELHENTHRESFTFIEESQLTAKIARLSQRIINEEKKRESPESELPLKQISKSAIEETAKKIFPEITLSAGKRNVETQLQVANILESAPESSLAKNLKAATNISEAQKIIKKAEIEQRRAILAEETGKEFSAKVHTILNGDCLEMMLDLPQKKFDVCLTDPIYGINAHKFGNSGGRMDRVQNDYDDSPETWRKIIPEALKLVSRLLKDDAHLYLSCDIRRYSELCAFVEQSSKPENPWHICGAPFIQYKLDARRVPVPGFSPRRSYEVWLYAWRGQKQVHKIIDDVISCSSDGDDQHGAKKPISLLKQFLSISCLPGENVLDFMAGSGSTVQACHELNLRCTAIEISKVYYGQMIERIKTLR